jgi:HEAT repeat protein
MRLSCPKTKIAARQALIEYGELAVAKLLAALGDRNVSRDIRLGIPRTLSKIASTASLNALLSALETEDGSIRYRVILGLEEMIRQFPGLHIEKNLIETAIDSEVRRYHHRFLTFFSLFGDPASSSENGDSLLRQALAENMDREKERVLRLLSLVYRADDIWRVAATLRNGSREKQAQAIEFLDNLLIGDLNRDVVPLFEDSPGFERFQRFLSLSGLTEFSTEKALRELLKQDDVWLKAATVWEIGLRGLSQLKKDLQQFLLSEEPVLKETTNSVISRI